MNNIYKYLILVLVMILSFLALTAIKGAALSGEKVNKMIFMENDAEWQKCQFANCAINVQDHSIDFNCAGGPSSLTTNIVDHGFEFDQVILSWNINRLDSLSAMSFDLEVSLDQNEWYRFGYLAWGAADSAKMADMIKSPRTIDGIGYMNTDVLVLRKPMRFARVTATASCDTSSSHLALRRLALAFSSKNSSWSEYLKTIKNDKKPVFGISKLAVPYFSQRNLPEDISGSCCSPSSVSMVLNYYNLNINPEKLAMQVYDPLHKMFGNWPFNVQAAYMNGLSKAWVEKHSGFDEIYDEVVGGRPVIISIAYGYDELPKSPIHEATVGHLIVVVGFEGPDIVICNDPAGHDASDGIIKYPRLELEKIWINHGGVAYHLWPE